MKINLDRLKDHPGEKETFVVSEQGPEELLEGMGATFLEPVELSIVVENTRNLFVGQGCLKTVLQLSCSRCLKDFVFPLTRDLDIKMIEDIHSTQFQQVDEMTVFVGDEVDLSPVVQEQIFLSIPINPLCSLDCKGLCPICGKDKNTGNCSCEEREIDPRWEKLKNLI